MLGSEASISDVSRPLNLGSSSRTHALSTWRDDSITCAIAGARGESVFSARR